MLRNCIVFSNIEETQIFQGCTSQQDSRKINAKDCDVFGFNIFAFAQTLPTKKSSFNLQKKF